MSNTRPRAEQGRPPGAVALIIPGLNGSGPAHWQTRWERERHDCVRVEQAEWAEPDLLDWSFALHRAIEGSARPVVLVAHSLGCMLVAHWAALFGDAYGDKIAGALLVAPCDLERPGVPDALLRFLPIPREPLAFRSTVVASTNDPWATIERSRCFAELWGSAFVNAGPLGHINADSRLESWLFGQVLLDDLIGAAPASRLDRRYGTAAALRSRQLSSSTASSFARGCTAP